MRSSQAIDAKAEQLSAWATFLDALPPDLAAVAARYGVDPAVAAPPMHALVEAVYADRLRAGKALDRWRMALVDQAAAAAAYLAWRSMLKDDLRVLQARPPADPEARARLEAVRAAFRVKSVRPRGVYAEADWLSARIREVPLPEAERWAAALAPLHDAVRSGAAAVADATAHRAVVAEETAQLTRRVDAARRFKRLDWDRVRRLAPALPPLPTVVVPQRRTRGVKGENGAG